MRRTCKWGGIKDRGLLRAGSKTKILRTMCERKREGAVNIKRLDREWWPSTMARVPFGGGRGKKSGLING